MIGGWSLKIRYIHKYIWYILHIRTPELCVCVCVCVRPWLGFSYLSTVGYADVYDRGTFTFTTGTHGGHIATDYDHPVASWAAVPFRSVEPLAVNHCTTKRSFPYQHRHTRTNIRYPSYTHAIVTSIWVRGTPYGLVVHDQKTPNDGWPFGLMSRRTHVLRIRNCATTLFLVMGFSLKSNNKKMAGVLAPIVT